MKNTANSDRIGWLVERAEYLREFVLAERYGVLSTTADARTEYLTVMTENMYHSQNASAIVRHCEAFGVQTLHTVETLCPFNPNMDIVRGTDKWIDLVRHSSTTEALAALKGDGYRIVATTPHRRSCTPETFDVTKGKFVLVMGTEHAGISDEVAAAADEFLCIPMCGMVESLNVSASAAILIYMLAQRVRADVEEWHLAPERRAEVMYNWLRESVKDADAVLGRRFGDDW